MIYNLPSGKKIQFPRKKQWDKPSRKDVCFDMSAGYQTLANLVDAMNGKRKFPTPTEQEIYARDLNKERFLKRFALYKAFMKQFTDAGHEVWDLYRNDEPYGFNLKDLDVGIYWYAGRGKRPHEIYLPNGSVKHFSSMSQFNKIINNKQNWNPPAFIDEAPRMGDNLIAKNLYAEALEKKEWWNEQTKNYINSNPK